MYIVQALLPFKRKKSPFGDGKFLLLQKILTLRGDFFDE